MTFIEQPKYNSKNRWSSNNGLFHFGDYELDDSCDHESDYEGDFCRCRVIHGGTVENTLSNWLCFYHSIWKQDKKTITLDDNLAALFCKHMFDPDDFEVVSSHGYYGDELDGFDFVHSEKFWKRAELFNSLSNTERLQMVLDMEYGFVISDIQQIKDWELAGIPKGRIIPFSIKTHKDKVEEYKRQLSQYDYKNVLMLFAPIVLPNGMKYRIIDGHHRFTAANEPVTYSVGKYEFVEKRRKIKGKFVTEKVKEYKTEYKTVDITKIWVIRPTENENQKNTQDD